MRIVSIPLWFDSNFLEVQIVIELERVSIPLWFDSNEEASRD